MPGSPNKTIVNALIGTFQREVKPDKLYDTLRKMSADLNAAYEALFDGPLPAVDGNALTNLNAGNLTGTIPDSFNIAYINRLNEFSRGQQIVQDDELESFVKFGFGDLLSDPVVTPSSYFRTGTVADGEFFLSQNADWDGLAFVQDDATDGSLALELAAGNINFVWYDSVLTAYRNTWKITGKQLFSANFADNAYLAVLEVYDTDLIALGGSASTDNSMKGHVSIPVRVSTALPTGAADANGLVVIDSTNKRFCFYIGALRYYVLGTAF